MEKDIIIAQSDGKEYGVLVDRILDLWADAKIKL